MESTAANCGIGQRHVLAQSGKDERIAVFRHTRCGVRLTPSAIGPIHVKLNAGSRASPVGPFYEAVLGSSSHQTAVCS